MLVPLGREIQPHGSTRDGGHPCSGAPSAAGGTGDAREAPYETCRRARRRGTSHASSPAAARRGPAVRFEPSAVGGTPRPAAPDRARRRRCVGARVLACVWRCVEEVCIAPVVSVILLSVI